MNMSHIQIRKMTHHDQLFIKEMVYQAIFVLPGHDVPSREILEETSIKKYYQDIGTDSDLGFIAYDALSHDLLGAFWLRLFSAHEKGYGFVNEATPELSMAVEYAYRGRGIGSALMKALLLCSEKRYPNIPLSVDSHNQAMRLYERFGFVVVKKEGHSVTMSLLRASSEK